MADHADPENGADKPAPTIPSLKKALLMRRLLGLGLAPLLVLAAVLAAPVLMPLLSFLAAVIVASCVGGFWPGFLATALGALALDFFFIEPIGTLRIGSSQERLALAGFVVVGTVLSFLLDLFLRARWRARNARSIVARNADLLQRFVEHVPAPVAMLDRSLRYMVVSRRWLMDYQLAERDVIGKSHHDLFPLMPEHWKGVHQRCLAGAIEKADEEALPRPDGSVEWVTWEVRPWHDEHGEIGGICIYAESITKRKEAEDALRRTTAELQRTFDVSPTGLVRCDKDMRFVSANAAYGAIAGVDVGQIRGKRIVDVIGEKAFERIRPNLERALRGERVDYETLLPYAKTGDRYLHIVYSPDDDGHGNVVGWVASVTDITERKRAEEALRRQSEQRLELLSNTVPALIFYLDSDRRFRSVNDAFTEWFGVPRERVVGQSIRELKGEEAWEAIRPHLDRAYSGETVTFQSETPHRLGGTRWIHTVYTPHRDDDGSVVGVIGFVTDITREKQTEKALRDADRRKDEFLAMLGHELRNPLTPIALSIGLMRRYGADRPETEKARGMIERQVNHLTRLVDDLLEVSRITSGKISLKKERVEVASVVNRAVETSAPLIESKKHQLTVLVPSQPIELDADPVRLSQALTNLLNNAAKYTEPGGRISFSVERSGGEAVFRVRDTGIGLAPDVLESIFEPFVQVNRSLDRSQGGLGLGLPLVRTLVELHGGTVAASSPGPGKGSEFVVRVPVATAAAAVPASTRMPVTRQGRGRRILVVDDSRDIAESLSDALAMSGHDVRTAFDGPTALEEVVRGFRPDIAILDLGLPGFDGYELARRIQRLPGLEEVILVALTGYGQEKDRLRSREAGFDRHLVKPVDLERVEEVLDSLSSVQH